MQVLPPQNATPMIRQYLEVKKKYQDAILFFRMGDFYEMFFEDALLASNLLEIALTSRNKGEENSVPFCGVPYHAASSYIARLIQAGHKVAICEQVEDPKLAKGIVRREVVRVITPGLVLESESLDSKRNNYLASLVFGQGVFGFAYADISTGEMGIAFFGDDQSLLAELHRREPKEILVPQREMDHPWVLQIRKSFPHSIFQSYEGNTEEIASVLASFSERFLHSWKQIAAQALSPCTEQAASHLLGYVRDTLKTEIKHLNEVRWIKDKNHLILDAATIRNLELVKNLHEGTTFGTLFSVLDHTQTSMGARRLKNWILYPLATQEPIQDRLQAIGEIHQKPELYFTLQEQLFGLVDLERLNGRIATAIANARDLVALAKSLERFPKMREVLSKFSTPFFESLKTGWENLEEITSRLLLSLKEDAPLTLREGGLIQEGMSPELDELRAILKDGKNHLARLEEQERQKTGISLLKVRYNRVFGYYIEVPNSKKEGVPSHYIRKQTLVNAERFITEELKTYEDKVLGAQSRIHQLEYEYFLNLRDEVGKFAYSISQMARRIADLDAICSLAEVAKANHYCAPQWVEGEELFIQEGRHPVLEKLFSRSRFVPNDIRLDGNLHRLIVLTGPNMAGKSTILRQAALITLLAHMGSYVPAQQLKLSLHDRIFTRIGASDNLSKNQSTFWVEMEETANILKYATSKSLVILDEIGRGTSTYDGLSVAWAIAENLHDHVKAKSIFATHYHELTRLADLKEGIKNFNIAVKEWDGKIIFLYRLLPGGTSQSYGLQVAALAGIPEAVIGRAKEILNQLQKKNHEPSPVGATNRPPLQEGEIRILNEIKRLSLETTTPFQALQLLYEFKKKISDG